jgi:hypothetical protein
MLSEFDKITKFCADNIELVDNEYARLASTVTRWPEQNLYTGNWNAILLRYNYKTVIPSELDNILQNTSIAMFSILSPGTEILKHQGHMGYCEHIWRVHFCIQNSENNVLSVNNVPYVWKRSESFYFDDTEEHWGWNRGSVNRVVLMFDIPRINGSKPPMTEKMNGRFA